MGLAHELQWWQPKNKTTLNLWQLKINVIGSKDIKQSTGHCNIIVESGYNNPEKYCLASRKERHSGWHSEMTGQAWV